MQLEKYMRVVRCPTCHGQRLNPQARAVRVGGKTLVEAVRHADRRPGRLARRRTARWRRASTPVAADHRRRGAQGDPRPARLPAQRRPALPDARPLRPDALRRRGPAHPPRRADRLRPGRRAVHPRRAVDRPAPARQRPPAAQPRTAARHGQHRPRRRARRGHDAGGRLPRRFRPRPRRPRRRGRRRRHATPRSSRNPDSLTGQYLSGKKQIAVPEAAPAGERQAHRDRRRPAQQPQEHHRRDPARACSSCVTGVSGSGKSSLVNDILMEGLRQLGARQRPASDEDGRRRGRPTSRTRSATLRPHRRRRAHRQGHRHRPVADRPHAALEPGDVHQGVRRDPRPVRPDARGEGPRLQAGPVQLQQARAAAARRARATAPTGWRWTSSPTSG